MPKRKLNKEEIENFKKEFLYYLEKFGLSHYTVYYEPRVSNTELAQVRYNVKDCNCTLYYSDNKLDDDEIVVFKNGTAKHEAIHILTGELMCLAIMRYATEDQIEKAEETLVNKLEKLIA